MPPEIAEASVVAPMVSRPSSAWSDGASPAAGTSFDRLCAFTLLWSGYIFFSQITIYYAWFQFSNPHRLFTDGLLTLLALVSFLRPRSVFWLALMLMAVIYNRWRGMPNMANHGLLTFFICVTMAAVIAKHALISGRVMLSPKGRAALYSEMAGLVRLELIVLYFYVVLHKLNYDYFNTEFSCGVILYEEICQRFPFMPTGAFMERLGLIGALVLEAAIPVLLCIRRTRVFGIFVGMFFHLLLSLHDNKFIYDFSAMLYALYFLFLPEPIFEQMRAKAVKILEHQRAQHLLGWRIFALNAAIIGLVALSIVAGARLMYGRITRGTVIDALHEIVPTAQRVTWFLLAGIAIVTLIWAVRQHWRASAHEDATGLRPSREPGLLRGAWSPLVIIVLLAIFNGMCPYIGLKTESAFAMYSNLRTELGQTNHLFMPVRFRVADYQEDIVEILESNDGYLASLAAKNEGLTALEFRKRLNKGQEDDFFVTFRRDGVQHTLTAADRGSDPLFAPPSWAERKFLHFRTVQLWEGPQLCGH